MFKTLQSKLLTAFLLFSTVCVIIVILKGYVGNKKDKIREAQHLLHSNNELHLKKFNAVADFFSFETRNNHFFKTKKSTILNQIDSLDKIIYLQFEKIEDNKEIIDGNSAGTNSELNIVLFDILKMAGHHENIIDEIVELILKRGHGDFGYIGSMRHNIQYLETSNKVDITKILVLKRNQRDYRVLYESRFIDSVKYNTEKIKNEIFRNQQLHAAEKESFMLHIANYIAFFDSLTMADKKIGIKDNSALYLELNQVEDKIQIGFEKLLELTYNRQNQLIETLNYVFWIFSLFLVLSSIFLSYYLSKRLTRPLSALAQSCRTFVNSNFKNSSDCEIVTHDIEIQNLVTDYNKLKSELVKLVLDFNKEVEKQTTTIKQQNKELSELNDSKDKFFSIIAHDLRDPISNILRLSDALEKNIDKYDKNKIHLYSRNISESTTQTLNLLDNLLTWAGLQWRSLDPVYQNCNLRVISDEIMLLCNSMIQNKNIEIINKISDTMFASCDIDITKAIFRNLITNAIKFTNNNGTITLTAIQKDQYIEVCVEDTGVGISAEKSARIFTLNKQRSTIGTNNEQGIGLGLMLCNELIEKQGGEIYFESETGKGSKFKFKLSVMQ